MSRAVRRGLLVPPILGCFGGGSLYGWSGYLPAVRTEFAISNAVASMVFSLALASFTLGVLLGPVVFARISEQWRLSAIAGLAVALLAIAGSSVAFGGFAVAYGAGFGFISGALYNHALSRASAAPSATVLVPVSVAAFGLGGAVFGPVHLWLTDAGWALWSVLPAMLCLACVAVLSLVLQGPASLEATQVARPRPWVTPDMVIARLWLIFAAGSCSGLIVLGFAAQILPAGGVGLASLAVFLAALGNTMGRLSSAVVAGRFGPVRVIAGALGLSMLALAALIVAGAPGGIAALLFCVAFAYGLLAATLPLLVRAQVDPAAFSMSFGWVFTGWGVAGLVGPWTAGWLLDSTGGIQMSLLGCIALAALSLVLVLRFPK